MGRMIWEIEAVFKFVCLTASSSIPNPLSESEMSTKDCSFKHTALPATLWTAAAMGISIILLTLHTQTTKSKPTKSHSKKRDSEVEHSSNRFDEEAVNFQSDELSQRGKLWKQHPSWNIPSCPRSTRTYSSNDIALDEIVSLLKKYDIDPNTGFLPSTDPLQRLSHARYHIWEDLADDLPKLLGARLGQVRQPLRDLPVLSIDLLVEDCELRRAHLLLCLFAHAFVWGADTPVDVIPAGIAVPLWEISQKIGLPAVLTHPDLILYNWRRLDQNGDYCMENLATLNNFFNGRDESWFYLITVEIEARGARAIVPMMLILDALKRFKNETQTEVASDKSEAVSGSKPFLGPFTTSRVIRYVTTQLNQVSVAMAGMVNSLSNMREGCLPAIFYHRVRPFLSGWKNNPRLPNGLLYSGVSSEPKSFYGGSAAQSALLPFFDITLGISHDGNSQSSKSNEFLLAMRDYMLAPHRKFLSDLKDMANLREFVEHQLNQLHILESRKESLTKEEVDLVAQLNGLQKSYDECVNQMTLFRSKHIAITAEYIIAQQKYDPATQAGPYPSLDSKGIEQSAGGKGTGGTDLMTFLKPLRDDCTETLIVKHND